MFVQGFYNSTSDVMVEDTVRVFLRNGTAPYTIVDSSIAKVNSSGAASFNFSNAVNGVEYYIQLKHRNSIETWSKTQQQFTSSMLSYDFTNSAAQAFGDNMQLIDSSPSRFGIYGGDADQNAQVNLLDIVNVYNASATFTNGYVQSDMNGDQLTNLSDIIITYNNSAAFIAKQTP